MFDSLSVMGGKWRDFSAEIRPAPASADGFRRELAPPRERFNRYENRRSATFMAHRERACEGNPCKTADIVDL
ncbi:hypothetical protein [Croceicoccus sp. YJ47]|uniref:hypothetical protein n=1 Tax=Croceicoccus sp. YJ47 TaxID=2798724 RepID=UPI0019216363|nr:hypothetical protein [Croceicoccus sp. YJ47]QQN75088.1 hypothetical protein JD971_05210 [Croceicoccus sp. YJ47]